MKEVIKAQRSLRSESGKILIYNEDRSLHQELVDPVISRAIGDRLKAYFEVNIRDDGIMAIIREVRGNW